MEILVTAELIGLFITIGLVIFKAGKLREKISNIEEEVKSIKSALQDVLNNFE